MKLNENGAVVLEDDADLCIRFFDCQKDEEGWPCFFDVKFVIAINGKRRASSYSFAGILEEEFAIRRRFPFTEKHEIRMIRVQNDDPCGSGAVVLPEFSSLTFKDGKTAILDGAEWSMRFKSVKNEAETEEERSKKRNDHNKSTSSRRGVKELESINKELLEALEEARGFIICYGMLKEGSRFVDDPMFNSLHKKISGAINKRKEQKDE